MVNTIQAMKLHLWFLLDLGMHLYHTVFAVRLSLLSFAVTALLPSQCCHHAAVTPLTFHNQTVKLQSVTDDSKFIFFYLLERVLRGSIQNVAWMKCKAKYVKPPVHRWLTNVTQYIWEENKKFRSFYFASVASIFIPVDCAVNRGNNERQIEKAKERLYVASVFRLKTKAIRSI